MKYRRQFEVQAPLAAVAAFHTQPASMAAITPPPVIVRIRHAPTRLAEGDEMAFTLWLGPLPVHWLARIEDVSAHGFTDRQLRGPFRTWVHRHTFRPRSETATLVQDEIRIELRRHPFWAVLGFLMWLNLPVLFAYRSWKTRRCLEGA